MNIKKVVGRVKGMSISDKNRVGIMSSLLAMAGSATPALAVTSGGQIAQNISSQFNNFGNLLVNACFLVGVGTAGSGLWEMKKAGDENNQGRDSHKSGLIKIAVGGGLAAVPSITGVGIGTIFNGGSGDGQPTETSLSFQGG